MEKISVIGNGALAMSVAAEAAQQGAEVSYIDLSGAQNSDKSFITICENGERRNIVLKSLSESFDSVKNVDIVVVAVTASHYDETFERLSPFMHDGQFVVFFPASFGALRFKNLFSTLDITICEAVSFPTVCEFDADGCVSIQNRKSCLNAAVSPASRTDEAIARLNAYFRILQPARNLLDTSLDNMNMTLHPLPVLLNLASTETNAAGFRHYMDGVSASVGRLMEKLDDERLQVGKAYGLELTSALQQLKNYYGDNAAKSIFEYVSGEDSPYPNVSGYGLSSRYIVEDVPYLLVPAISLAKKAGVETPMMELCVQLANSVKNVDFRQQGLNLEKLGLAGCSDVQRLIYEISN